MKTETVLILLGIIALVGVGVFYFNQQTNSKVANVGDSKSLTLEDGSENTDSPEITLKDSAQQPMAQQKNSNPPAMTIDSNKTYTAVVKTTEGDITVELNAKQTPVTVNNFVALARKKFYNNVIFHRTIKGFMIQGGDPTGTGSGGPGYSFEDEPFEGEYTRGTIAMANSGPDTNGSQFFIMHADYPLPPNYTIFGKVTTGLETVDKIAEAPTQPGGEGSTPVKPVKINSVEIQEK